MTAYAQIYHQLPLIKAPKIHTDLLWDLSFLFIGLAVVYFICVFFYRNRISARAKRVKQRKRELSPMISEFLFYEDEASKDEKSNYVNLKIEIRQLLKDDFNRKVLSEVLLDLRKDLAGDTQKRLFRLYQDLGLHNDAFERLKSWRWERISKAILDLTQMQVAEAYTFVAKFINDKRATIRKQAEIAVVTLKPEGIDYFLDTTKYKISEWQQLKILDVLRNEANYQPPRFKAWLTSTNRYVVLFALRLIKFYNQNDADAALIELVKHKSSQIKAEAIGCIKEFHIVSALPTLKLVFWKSSIDIKISILSAIGALGDEKDLEFLKLIEKKEANFSVRSKAHSSINAIAPDSIMPSKGLVNTAKYSIPDDIEIKEEEEEIALEIEPLEPQTADTMAEINEEEDVIHVIPDQVETRQKEVPITEAKPDAMEENQEPVKSENPTTREDDRASQEREPLSFDFLPVVVADAIEIEPSATHEQNASTELNDIVVNIEKLRPEHETSTDPNELVVDFEEITIAESSRLTLNDILVNFEEVSEEEGTISEQQKRVLDIREEELAFLPIVTDSAEEAVAETTSADQSNDRLSVMNIEVQFEDVIHIIKNSTIELPSDFSEFNTPEILDVEVIYDEITPSPADQSDSHSKKPSDPYFLSHLSESPQIDTGNIASDLKQQSLQSYDDMEPQDEQKFKKIIKDLIDFNEQQPSNETTKAFQDWALLEFGDEFIDKNEMAETDASIQDESDRQSDVTTEETIHDQPAPDLSIPIASVGEDILEEVVLFKENTEESRMQLLDDIAEMGDYREIPLLNELLVNEKYKTVKDRVKRLIEQFSDIEESPKQDLGLKPFNVFEDLFRTCDTEAKLILMDEIVAVGDEGEIDFLEDLLEDEEEAISTKAAKILEELKAKLSSSNAQQTDQISEKAIDPSEVAKMEVLISEETLAEYDSLMEELQIQSPPSTGIFDLTFELTEPLTATVEESNLDNTAADKSGTQESLLLQLYTKFIDKLNG